MSISKLESAGPNEKRVRGSVLRSEDKSNRSTNRFVS